MMFARNTGFSLPVLLPYALDAARFTRLSRQRL
jgi:hypothetical protein